MQERMVDAGGAMLAIRDSGGSDTPIVFLSGGPGYPDYLQEVAHMVGPRRVVTYDQRGTGASRVLDGDYSVEAHVSDLERIREALDTKRMHLFGHSWGGVLAQVYATAHIDAVASLYLCSPVPGVGRDWVTMERAALRYTLRRSSGSAAVLLTLRALLGQLPGSFGEDCVRKVYAQTWVNYQRPGSETPPSRAFVKGVSRSTAVKTRISAMRLPAEMLTRVLPTANIPIKITFGDRDIFGDQCHTLARRYPNADYECWEGCGHLAWFDDETRFRRSLRDFYDHA